MSDWYMLTLVGEDRPGIVARVTRALCDAGLSLGETSMIRLGGNFTIMMMVSGQLSAEQIDTALASTIDELDLCMHLDPIEGHLHQHLVPNVAVRVVGADRAGIVAEVTEALQGCGFNILELASDVAGDASKPVYIMNIEGFSDRPIESLQQAVAGLDAQGVDVTVDAIETLFG